MLKGGSAEHLITLSQPQARRGQPHTARCGGRRSDWIATIVSTRATAGQTCRCGVLVPGSWHRGRESSCEKTLPCDIGLLADQAQNGELQPSIPSRESEGDGQMRQCVASGGKFCLADWSFLPMPHQNAQSSCHSIPPTALAKSSRPLLSDHQTARMQASGIHAGELWFRHSGGWRDVGTAFRLSPGQTQKMLRKTLPSEHHPQIGHGQSLL
jgi:hypothetical protein